jgi:TctA family transporter
MAYGGRPARPDGTLPVRYRLTSTLTLVFLGAAAWSIFAKLGPALWVLAAIFALNTMANLTGRHPVERWGMSALTLGLAACCTTLALT